MRSIRSIRSLLNRTPARTVRPRVSSGTFFEALEERKYLSLVGIGTTYPLGYPLMNYDQTGHIAYNAATQSLDLTNNPGVSRAATATQIKVTSSGPSPAVFNGTQLFTIDIKVANDGTLIGGVAGNDLQIGGRVTINSTVYNGTLLTGEIQQFGYTDPGNATPAFDFVFTVSGGLLSDAAAGDAGEYPVNSQIGITMTSPADTDLSFPNHIFSGSFTTSFDGKSQGQLGPVSVPVHIPPPPPTINTVPGGTVVIGSGDKLTDTATLSGGTNPTGTVTFYLFAPGVTPNADDSNNVYTDTVTVTGNGDYDTSAGNNPGGYLPGATGNYEWLAVYSDGVPADGTVSDTFGDEPETVIPASPSINTSQQPASATVGTSIADQATVSGGDSPTGTVTFTLYDNAAGTGTPLFTDANEPLSGGVATSLGYIATATGTDYWVATYNGDSNNNAVTSGTGDEPVTVTPASPSINTSQQPASATVGTSIADQATVSGGDSPTGTVTFTLYDNAAGTGTPLFTDANEPLSGGVATSLGYIATATGTDYWVATYNGDSNNNAVTSGTGDEPVTVTPASPSINTSQQPASATVGTSIADQATVSGGDSPTGTVTFTLYDNAAGTGTPLFTDADEPLSGGVATSLGYIAMATGTDYWVATYNGDSNNNSVTSGTGDEPVTISPATPLIDTTQQPATAKVGTSIADQATVSGGDNPTGTVTFNLYDNAAGTGTPLFTDTESLIGGVATSAGYIATAAGTDYWVATYNGDSNNISVSSGTGDEPVCLNKVKPDINTSQQPATAVVGSSIADQATVSGGYNPTGTVTFNLYDNAAGTGTPLFTDANEPLSGGVATSVGYIATAAGTDYWVAKYNGDSNNKTVKSGTGDEPVTVSPATPSINTSQQPASAVVGSSIADQATVSGGDSPTGTVTFTLYDNAAGTGTPLFTDANEPLSGGVATSLGYIATATGTDYWVATYNGDSNNSSVSSGTGDEPVTVTPNTPGINTQQQPATAVVGSSIADKATVSGLVNPGSGDTVTFHLYSSATTQNGGTLLFTDTETLSSGGVATSAGYIATAAGTDYWVATFNGDSNNSTVTSGKADEPVCLTKASPAINTQQQPATALVGASIADKATVTGGYHPGGTVTFKLYNNSNGTGTPLFTDTETLVGGVATSGGYIASAAGTDYWIATYNGDGNNSSVTSGKADEPVCITSPSGSISGTKFFDVTGNGTSSDDTGLGGVTINLYKDVNGNGVYNAGTDTLYATTTTASGTGAYSFNNLPLGKYLVSENVPTGYVQTVPGPTVNNGYYAANITSSGQVVANNNFDDFMIPTCTPTNVYFVINNCTTVTDLRGNTHEGDTVTAYFTVPAGMDDTLTLVSYTAPDSYFNANDASEQQVFQIATGTFTPGAHSLTVEIPCSDYQIDFVCGAAIDQLGPAGSNIFYSAQNRLISADNEGNEAQCSNFACICGNIFNDLNCDGTFQGSECGLGGVCVTLTGTDDLGHACTFTRYTDSNGCYSFDGLRKGTYKITETQPNGCLDGKDTVGSCGGSASNNDCFSNIKVNYGSDGAGYNFGEITPASIDGFVYLDINNNGVVDRGEGGLANVTVKLTGTNNQGQSVSLSTKTDSDGYYAFGNLIPGSYKLVETTPSGYTDGKDTVGSLSDGSTSNDTFASISLGAGASGIDYNFGERKSTNSLTTGSTGSIAFWRNSQGQALIKALNGGSTKTNLGNWLATNYPKMYGSQAGADNLAGLTNAQVAAFYVSLFNGGSNVEPSVMATALSVYVTDSDLAGTTATGYNFKVSSSGLGALTTSVSSSNGSAFGTSTSKSTTRTTLQLLTATNSQAVSGSLYNGNSTLLADAYSVYDTLNRSGDATA